MPYNPSVRIQMNVNASSNNSVYRQAAIVNLVKAQQLQQSKAPTSLLGPMVARIHNVRPGCGSCGK
jgi:hypothetical protein